MCYRYQEMNPAGFCIGDIVGIQVSFKLIPTQQNNTSAVPHFKLISVLRGVSLMDNRQTMVRKHIVTYIYVYVLTDSGFQNMIKKNSQLLARKEKPRAIKRRLTFATGPMKRREVSENEKDGDISRVFDRMAVDDTPNATVNNV
jgi:hypothetical protein